MVRRLGSCHEIVSCSRSRPWHGVLLRFGCTSQLTAIRQLVSMNSCGFFSRYSVGFIRSLHIRPISDSVLSRWSDDIRPLWPAGKACLSQQVSNHPIIQEYVHRESRHSSHDYSCAPLAPGHLGLLILKYQGFGVHIWLYRMLQVPSTQPPSQATYRGTNVCRWKRFPRPPLTRCRCQSPCWK